MALEGLSRGIFRSLGFLKNRRKLDEDELREMTRSLRRALQEADFNVRQTKEIVERMESRLREEEPRPGLTFQTPPAPHPQPRASRILFFWRIHSLP